MTCEAEKAKRLLIVYMSRPRLRAGIVRGQSVGPCKHAWPEKPKFSSWAPCFDRVGCDRADLAKADKISFAPA